MYKNRAQSSYFHADEREPFSARERIIPEVQVILIIRYVRVPYSWYRSRQQPRAYGAIPRERVRNTRGCSRKRTLSRVFSAMAPATATLVFHFVRTRVCVAEFNEANRSIASYMSAKFSIFTLRYNTRASDGHGKREAYACMHDRI